MTGNYNVRFDATMNFPPCQDRSDHDIFYSTKLTNSYFFHTDNFKSVSPDHLKEIRPARIYRDTHTVRASLLKS